MDTKTVNSTDKKLKVVFVTGSLVYNCMVVEKVIQSSVATVESVIVGDFIYPKIGFFKSVRRVIEKAGWEYFFFKAFETTMMKLLVLFGGPSRKLHLFSQLPEVYQVPVKYTQDLNAPAEVEYLKSLNPDVIVSMIPQKIGDEIMKIPRIGVINLHPGLLPEYRSFGGYFWPLIEDFGSYGYTIHFINEVIDGGDIVLREAFPVTPDSTVQNLYYYTLKHGAEGLLKVLEQFRAGNVIRKVQNLEGTVCRPWPNAEGIKKLRQKGYCLFKFKDFARIFREDI